MADLYFDLSRGISGDMFAAALIDVGADAGALQEVLQSLHLPGWETKITRVEKAGLNMCDFKVRLEVDNHDNDPAWLFPHLQQLRPAGTDSPLQPWQENAAPQHEHEHEHAHEHDQAHGHGHTHRHGHEHEHYQAQKGERTLGVILPLIERSSATAGAKALAVKIFKIIAAAEAKAHHSTLDQVHFHEVGALDSIIDVLAAAVLYDSLQVEHCTASELCEGQGMINCQHGLLPIPVPAVRHIIEDHQLPLQRCREYAELITPTGAAIIAALEPEFTAAPPAGSIIKTGYGAGKRPYARPSFVTAQLFAPA